MSMLFYGYDVLLIQALLLLVLPTNSQVNLSATLCADPIAQTSAFWITGQESGPEDDDQSKVSCPTGYYASECICENERYCDGAVLQPDTRTCIAYRISHDFETGSQGAKAMVRCKLALDVEVKTVYRADQSSGHTLTCPPGYIMESCSVVDHCAPCGGGRGGYLIRRLNNEEVMSCTWDVRPPRVVGRETIRMAAACVKRKS